MVVLLINNSTSTINRRRQDMRKRLQIFLLISISLVALSISSAQIPNAGFETWTAGSPASWVTDNASPLIIPITQSTDAHSGTYSMQGTTVSYLTIGYPPTAYAEFTVSVRYSSLKGWYKFTPVSGDSLNVHAIFYKSGTPIGYTIFSTKAAASSFAQFTSPITYITADVPDDTYIEIDIESPTSSYHVGSTFKIDDLSFGPATGVQESSSIKPDVFALSQNYPNPFNPSTMITYQIPTDGTVRLDIYDVMGRMLTTLVNEEKSAGQYTVPFNGSRFTSGIYFYHINVITQDGKSFSQTNKMILMK
jgi:hypothetical protein